KTKKAEKKEKKKAEVKKKVEKKKTKKAEKKEKKKAEVKKKVEKKKTKEEKKEEEKTLEEQLEEQLSDEEIENFQIEKVDMERLTHKVCDILAERESSGMIQSELWKKLKLSSRDGSRLALKLERMGNITREKILEKGRWTYKLIIKKTPISTTSIENAPCLICPVEQKCTLEGEISPRTCQWIEEWVTIDTTKLKKEQ
ncbi:MAG: transcriptional regulator, partial [Nitrosopumilaceae archaeon]